jgi:hypothetical protein
MKPIEPKHPQAVVAIWLANQLRGAPPELITRTLNLAGCPRQLFVLASTLLAKAPYVRATA